MFRLVAVSGVDQGRDWELAPGRNAIGRSSDVTVQLRDAKSSRLHCVINLDGSAWTIEDLNSLNSTLLNGKPIRKGALSDGDRISIGETDLLFTTSADAGSHHMMTTVLQKEISDRNLKDFERELLAHGLVGRSRAIKLVLEAISKVAPTDATVLITGPSGSGKELVANALHYNSPRRAGNFVSVNCAALPESLLESELFGYERGAFTGATASRIGKFHYANGGTIFLDEIGDMPVGCQAKILRVLQERAYCRLGSHEIEHSECRIIAATNMDLEKAVEEKIFREDLFYRINVINIAIPPLLERIEDVEMLAGHFLEKYGSLHHKPIKSFSPEAIAAMMSHHWPGNVRELQNCIERAVLLGESSTITPNDLQLNPRHAPQPGPAMDFIPRSLRDVEREHILKVLDHTGGNKKRAAEILGIERNTLYDRLRQYGSLE